MNSSHSNVVPGFLLNARPIYSDNTPNPDTFVSIIAWPDEKIQFRVEFNIRINLSVLPAGIW
jgi:hypothetical protein